MSSMPLEMWREILVRLPSESLIRARAVSKGWQAVIDDPCFVRAHTTNNQKLSSPSSKIIIQNSTAVTCYSLDLETLSCRDGKHPIAAVPLDPSDTPAAGSSSSECNGLVLTQNPEALTIWNPLTHERIELPAARGLSQFPSFGLGYDATTDDYKAVVILSSRRATHVYSLKSDTWTRSLNFPPRDGPADGPGIFMCGALHWLSVGDCGDCPSAYDDKIIALDLGTEKYSLLQMPLTMWSDNKPKFSPDMLLNVLGGCLAVCESSFCRHLDVWVMKVYGDEGSWIKSFSIKNEQNVSVWFGYLRPVAFVMKEEFLVFLQDSKERFFLFGVETKSFKRVGIRILHGEDDSGSDSFSCAQQMFGGTIFRLHANCGGGRKTATTSTCSKKKKNKASEQLVFCIRDAKYDNEIWSTEDTQSWLLRAFLRGDILLK